MHSKELEELYGADRTKLKQQINTLRERVTHFNLPYLSLPSNTPKDVALQVFINMNTNSKPLSLYDIIVAEVEKCGRQIVARSGETISSASAPKQPALEM